MAASGTPRAVPFYCPFCGEQDLRPAEPRGWHCAICDRTFELEFIAVGTPGEPT
jgi:ribosomal protein L37AE/L43A